jgi:polar amino acid transport system substrate-binding protein
MNMILRLIFACLFFLSFWAANAWADLKFGVAAEPYPPFTSKDSSGKWVGWEIDLMAAVCRQLKEKCEIVEVAWDGIIPALTSKRIDVIWSSMSITPERRKVIDFTDKYYRTPSVIIGAKDGDKDISPEHLAGKTIGFQVSTIHQKYVQKYYGRSNLKTYLTQDEANSDLVAGRIDYVQADAITLDSFLRTDVGSACCELKNVVPEDREIRGEGAGGGVRKEDIELKARLNAAIRAVRKSGEYEAITKRYFSVDIYGN